MGHAALPKEGIRRLPIEEQTVDRTLSSSRAPEGTQYTHRLQQAGVQISMAEVGQSAQNGYAERLIRTIKEEEVDLNDYADLEDARRQIGRFIDEVYLSKRIHNREEDFRLSSSLGYLTPAEFEAQWHKQQRASASSRKKG